MAAKVDFVIVESGVASVQYSSGKMTVYGNGKAIPDSIYRFCNRAADKGRVKHDGENRAKFY